MKKLRFAKKLILVECPRCRGTHAFRWLYIFTSEILVDGNRFYYWKLCPKTRLLLFVNGPKDPMWNLAA